MDQQSSLSYSSKSNGRMPLQVFITSSVISKIDYPNENIDINENSIQCIRCGISMEKTKSVFINIQPPVFLSKKIGSSMSMEIVSNSISRSTSLESTTDTYSSECCSLNSEASKKEAYSLDVNSCSHNYINTTNSKILNSDDSETDELTSINVSAVGSQHSITPNGPFLKPSISMVDFAEDPISNPCPDCHVSVLNDMSILERSNHECISLMLQLVHQSSVKESVGCQTDEYSFGNGIGLAMNILEIYPKTNPNCESADGGSLPGSKQGPRRHLPELDAEAEAAYRCHLKNLVPCSHCSRRFTPDRVMVHENACIERPRKKKKSDREKRKTK